MRNQSKKKYAYVSMLYDKRYGEVIEVESGQTKKRVEKKCVKTLNEKQGAGE